MPRLTFKRNSLRRYELFLVQAAALCWLCGLTGCGGGFRAPAGSYLGRHYNPAMQVYMAMRVDSTGTDLPELRVSVPYRSLVFRRLGDQFVSGIEVTVVAVAHGERVGGGVGSSDISLLDADATQSQTRLHCQVPVRLQTEDPVVLQVMVKPEATAFAWKNELEYRPSAAKSIPLYFADFIWNLDDDPQMRPQLGFERDSLEVRIVVAPRPNREWPDGGVTLLAAVRGQGEENRRTHRRLIGSAAAIGNGREYRLTWAARDLRFGRSELTVQMEALAASGNEKLTLDPPRTFVNLQIPWWDSRQWKMHVSWLDGLVVKDKRNQLDNLDPDEREPAWYELWEVMGGQLGVPAKQLLNRHLWRVIEADDQFGGQTRGALSDRGRIYIRHGRPDNVRSFGDDMSRESRWEIWTYNEQRLRFTFYDPHGLGDFQLYDQSAF
ncbi:MAG: GWxTD domain-containing protein [bacterium]